MIQEVFLTNENTIRGMSLIDNNVESKYLLSALREAQDVYYQQVVGKTLYDKLRKLVGDGVIDDAGNEAYKALLDESQMFLVYQSVANLCLVTNVKISNGGLQQTTDENLTTLNLDDTFTYQQHLKDKADFYMRRLQEYLWENRADLPELTQTKCNQLNAMLNSAADCGLWLGGKRGKGYNKCRKRF